MSRVYRACTVLLLALAFLACPGALKATVYYDLTDSIVIVPSPTSVSVQFDSTYGTAQQSVFAQFYQCLDNSVSPKHIHRGFYNYGLTDGWNYEEAAYILSLDSAVHRVLPVYLIPSDSAEFSVSDLIDVQFYEELDFDSALAILSSYGLSYVDSSVYRHNLLVCALNENLTDSPIEYGNALHRRPETEWACARQYADVHLMGDSYLIKQYSFINVGQNGGTPDNDFDADSAWLVEILDSTFAIAVLDQGIEAHPDISSSRILAGYDFYDNDNDPSPGVLAGHGMACASIIAASRGDTGIVGVFPTCHLVPVRMMNDNGVLTDTGGVAAAIRYAGNRSQLLSCSWAYDVISPLPNVAAAIRDVSNHCPGGTANRVDPGAQAGSVIVMAAGNYANDIFRPDDVRFPANMPDVIAVGAIDNTGERWDYSCMGDDLDVVAPSGVEDPLDTENRESNLWAADRVGGYGWNPVLTGYDDADGDQDYTSSLGGTSGACAEVAGIVGLILARGHNAISACHPIVAIRQILGRSAEDLGDSTGWDGQYGYGRANAYRALLSLIHGDINNDAYIDALDLNSLTDILFFGGGAALNKHTADINCDGTYDALDLNDMIDYIFFGAAPPDTCFKY